MASDDVTELNLRDLVTQLEALADRDRVSLSALVRSWGQNSFLPILLVLALVVMSPLSGIPMLSSLCGIAIAVVSVQMLLKRDHLWLPEVVGRRTVPPRRLLGASRHMRRIADVFDRYTRADRLHQLVDRRGRVVTQTLCAVAGGLMPLLELVPFSSSVLGTAVLCFALSLSSRDGLLTVVGAVVLSLVFALPWVALAATNDVVARGL